MSDRQIWARRMLAAAAAEIVTWGPDNGIFPAALIGTLAAMTPAEIMTGPRGDWDRVEVFRTALTRIAADPLVEKLAVEFGYRIPLTPRFEVNARRDPVEEAAKRMMHAVAFAVADPSCRMTAAKNIVEKREELEKARAQAMALTPFDERNERARDGYVSAINTLLTIQAPLSDPIVERRKPAVLAKRFAGDLPDDEAYSHARAVKARLRDEARHIFGKNGDRVLNAFVEAATGIRFTRDDMRSRNRLR